MKTCQKKVSEKSVKTFTHRMPGSLEICLPTLDFLNSRVLPAIHLQRIQPSSRQLPIPLVRGEGAQRTYRHWQARQQTKEKLRRRLPTAGHQGRQWGGWRYPRLSAHSALYPTALLVLRVPALQRFAQQRVPCSLYRAASSFRIEPVTDAVDLPRTGCVGGATTYTSSFSSTKWVNHFYCRMPVEIKWDDPYKPRSQIVLSVFNSWAPRTWLFSPGV